VSKLCSFCMWDADCSMHAERCTSEHSGRNHSHECASQMITCKHRHDCSLNTHTSTCHDATNGSATRKEISANAPANMLFSWLKNATTARRQSTASGIITLLSAIHHAEDICNGWTRCDPCKMINAAHRPRSTPSRYDSAIQYD
jgi:hypothetical protein